jgi:hypothetical protein
MEKARRTSEGDIETARQRFEERLHGENQATQRAMLGIARMQFLVAIAAILITVAATYLINRLTVPEALPVPVPVQIVLTAGPAATQPIVIPDPTPLADENG